MMNHGMIWDLPSGNFLHSYWKWHIEIVDLPNEDGDFHSYVNVYQRVYGKKNNVLYIFFYNRCYFTSYVCGKQIRVVIPEVGF